MSAPETAIRAALTARLQTLSGLPSVAWENVAFTPVPSVTYLAPALLPGEPFQAEIGPSGQNWHLGVYQVSIFAPKNVGVGALNTLRDAIVTHFKRGTTMTSGAVTVTATKAYPSAAITEVDRVHVPITIRYRVLAAN